MLGSLLAQGRGRSRERIAQVQERHAQVRVPGRWCRTTGNVVPGIAVYVGILADERQCAKLSVPPQVLYEADRGFLDAAILPGRRTVEAVADQAGAVRVELYVPSDVDQAVIREQRGVTMREFEAIHRRAGVNKRDTPICACLQVRRLAEYVPASTVTIEVMSQQAESFEDFHVQVDEPSTPGR